MVPYRGLLCEMIHQIARFCSQIFERVDISQYLGRSSTVLQLQQSDYSEKR